MNHQPRIMIVEDNPSIGEMLQAMLRRKGLHVILHRSPADALAAFEKHPDSVDLVLSDHAMPEMTGLELLNAIHDIRPDLPLILLTGLPPDDFPPHIVVLAKPIRYKNLYAAIATSLSKAAREGVGASDAHDRITSTI